jgi:2-dehydropantoate 2-reductase
MANGFEPTRVLVVGTGAMASLFGARLQRFAGARVCLTGTWREALDAIRARGIVVEDESGAWSAAVDAIPIAELPKALDSASSSGQRPVLPSYALVLVKAHQTAAVASPLARSLPADGHVLTLQNGLGNRETLAAALGSGRVSLGIAAVGARLLGPGHVRATGGSVVLGTGATAPAPLQDFSRLLAASGFETTLEPDVDRLLWRKLVVNCAINPLSALAGCSNGDLVARPDLRRAMADAAREAGAVATAVGIELGADPVELVLAVAQQTATNRSSMLQDVERGARTEIDALNGALVREARRVGVPAPVNETLWRRVLEREGRSPREATA